MLPVLTAALLLSCAGNFTQGGFAVCEAPPGASLLIDGRVETAADASGHALVGFDRDAPEVVQVRAEWQGETVTVSYAITPRTWQVQRVDGLPPQTVRPTRPEVLEKIARDSALKAAALNGRAEATGFLDEWRWPIEAARVSGPFGNARVLNGVPGRPHYGIDLAAPTGTPVLAPASGVVSLAQDGMHYEGGLVFIDHGQGLTSMYLHLSEIKVEPGQRVEAGQHIGAVGATGRASGPHLCWRLKWRDRNLDPSLTPVMELAPLSP